MPFDYVSKVSGILASVLGFFVITKDTIFESFFRWLYLGIFLDWIYISYKVVMPLLLVGYFTKFFRDWRYLALLGVLFFAFFFFVFPTRGIIR